jgi:5-methyltetrahydropteroyltriglutamate--homocysteine methyltransferase
MKCSTDRILTTHAGSLPRPAVLTQAIVGHDRGTLGPDEAGALPTQIRDAVATIAKSQAEAGVDIINDGEACAKDFPDFPERAGD